VFMIIFSGAFDKDSVKIYVNIKVFKKQKIDINFSVGVEEEEIPDRGKIKTIGISVNNGNVITVNIKPNIYVMHVGLDNYKKVFEISFLDKYPVYD
jgi:hypothetical protein